MKPSLLYGIYLQIYCLPLMINLFAGFEPHSYILQSPGPRIIRDKFMILFFWLTVTGSEGPNIWEFHGETQNKAQGFEWLV